MIIHVVPKADLGEHDTYSTSCRCDYTTTIVDSNIVVTHASWDLRELVEEANLILGNESETPGWDVLSKEVTFR